MVVPNRTGANRGQPAAGGHPSAGRQRGSTSVPIRAITSGRITRPQNPEDLHAV